jgi:hypothetical protein
MGSQELQNFIDNCSPDEKRKWVRKQIAAAKGLQTRLRQRMGAPLVVNGLAALPSELRSGERKHRLAAGKFVPDTDLYTGTPLVTNHEQNWKRDDEITTRDFNRTLATAIVDSGRWGTLRVYVERLPEYAASKCTAKEIADNLGVKPGSINPFRMRVRRALEKKDEGGD